MGEGRAARRERAHACTAPLEHHRAARPDAAHRECVRWQEEQLPRALAENPDAADAGAGELLLGGPVLLAAVDLDRLPLALARDDEPSHLFRPAREERIHPAHAAHVLLHRLRLAAQPELGDGVRLGPVGQTRQHVAVHPPAHALWELLAQLQERHVITIRRGDNLLTLLGEEFHQHPILSSLHQVLRCGRGDIDHERLPFLVDGLLDRVGRGCRARVAGHNDFVRHSDWCVCGRSLCSLSLAHTSTNACSGSGGCVRGASSSSPTPVCGPFSQRIDIVTVGMQHKTICLPLLVVLLSTSLPQLR